MSAEEPLLSLEHVSKTFAAARRSGRTVRAVIDASLSVGPAETVAIVGESGSGKTTVARIALGLVRADNGVVRVRGVDIGDKHGGPSSDVRRAVQPVFQDATASLNPRRTVRSTLTQAIRATSSRRLPRSEIDERAADALQRVGLHPARDFLARYPRELSGGQRQRLAIARATAVRPQLIVADEPLSGADASTRGQILNLFEDLQRDLGLGCVLITHDISVARAFAHRTIVMTEGRIVEEGLSTVVLNEPQHAYTRQLIAAVPRL